jgi:hypothetical protein
MADGFEGDWRDEVLVEDGAAEDGECDAQGIVEKDEDGDQIMNGVISKSIQ